MSESRARLEAEVIALVAEALDRNAAEIRAESSLIDDLGAESIDFLDLVFRIEAAFNITVPDQELWRGSIQPAPGASIADEVAALRARTPGFRWDRFPDAITADDLPRLITIRTIVDYLESRGIAASGGPS